MIQALAGPAGQCGAPEEIYIRETGIYIVLNQWFVTESGFFVPRDEKVFTVSENSDPSYKRVGPSIYWYEIRGLLKCVGNSLTARALPPAPRL